MKYKQNYTLLIVVFVWFISTSMVCNSVVEFRDVEFVNLSNDTIYVAYSCKSEDNIDGFDAKCVFKSQYASFLDTLEPGCSLIFGIQSWDHSVSKDDNINWLNEMVSIVLVFKKASVDKCGIDYVVESNAIDKKYLFTYFEIEKKGFIIYYTGE